MTTGEGCWFGSQDYATVMVDFCGFQIEIEAWMTGMAGLRVGETQEQTGLWPEEPGP